MWLIENIIGQLVLNILFSSYISINKFIY